MISDIERIDLENSEVVFVRSNAVFKTWILSEFLFNEFLILLKFFRFGNSEIDSNQIVKNFVLDN